MVLRYLIKPAITLLCIASVSNAWASSTSAKLENVELDMSPITLKEGAKIIMANCIQCHSLKYIKYRHLLTLGFSKEEVDEMRGEQKLNTPLQRAMDMDTVRAMFGLVPPDLSLIAKARAGGNRYLYSLLVGYEQNESGRTDNRVFPGIRMPDVFGIAFTADESEREEIRKKAASITAFLEWASDPNAKKRETIGYYVIAYLIFLSTLYYFLKKRIWSRVRQRGGRRGAHRTRLRRSTGKRDLIRNLY